MSCTTCLTRRHVLVAGTSGAAAVLTGCATYGDEPDAPAEPQQPAGEPAGALARVDDVPVGGGLILEDAGVVLTQPEAGTIKAFGAECTHQGCAVTAVEDGRITCPCHGSAFAVADGAVLAGPASRPLPARQVTVADGAITLA